MLQNHSVLIDLARFYLRQLGMIRPRSLCVLRRDAKPSMQAGLRILACNDAVLKRNLRSRCGGIARPASAQRERSVRACDGWKRMHHRRHECFFHLCQLDDRGIRPDIAVLEPLCTHCMHMQTILLLLEGRLRMSLWRVLYHLIILSEEACLRVRRGADSLQNKVAHASTPPGLRRVHDDVESFLILASREPVISLVRHHPGTRSVDCLSVDEHPEAECPQAIFLFDRQGAIRLWTHVQKEVSSTRTRMNQDLQQIVIALVDITRRLISPGRAHRHVGFPRPLQRRARNVLLRCFNGSARHDCVRLLFPYDVAKTLRFSIEERHRDRSVLRHKLRHLLLIACQQTRVHARLHLWHEPLDLLAVFVQPEEVIGRKINARCNSLLSKRGKQFAGDVFSVWRLHDVEVGRLRIPHAETVVMLGSKDHVTDTRHLGQARHCIRVEVRRIEGLWQLTVEAIDVVIGSTSQGVADDNAQLAVDAPVNEHPQTLVTEPLQSLRLVLIRALRKRFKAKKQRQNTSQIPLLHSFSPTTQVPCRDARTHRPPRCFAPSYAPTVCSTSGRRPSRRFPRGSSCGGRAEYATRSRVPWPVHRPASSPSSHTAASLPQLARPSSHVCRPGTIPQPTPA